MKNSIRTLLSDKQGLALIEFALFLPLALLMFFGVVEFARYVIITQKAERAAYVLSNITSQFTPLKPDVIETEVSVEHLDSDVLPQFGRTMDVYSSDADRVSIISSITKTGLSADNSSVTINWQRAGGGSLVSSEAVSLLNGVSASAINSALPNGTTAGTSPSFPAFNGQLMNGALKDMKVGENMLITETFYSYQTFLGGMLSNLGATSMPATVMKSVVFTRPRNGNIDTLVRPDAGGGTGNPDDVNSSCVTVTLVPPYRTCSPTVYTITGNTCTAVTQCNFCNLEEVCKTCTTPFNGTTTCSVTSDKKLDCADQTLTTIYPASSCNFGSTTPTTTTTPPPPS